ncbi:hypothetical protein CPB86DRAFT_790710 [Serendipita vermifera]|nr:hypothetical protein CPB86DRAFT_790710 [Serendipita vermifera]
MDQAATKKKEGGQPSRAKNCAECRRLKVKCDRTVPCQNCVKRGTASICPDGQLAPKGHRLILSSTEDLHARIDELTERIRELEDALAKLQALHSDDPHPLLSNSNDAPITSFGSLVIRDDGNTRFFGATSGVEWLWTVNDPDHPDKDLSPEPQMPSTGIVPRNNDPLALIDSEFPLPIGKGSIDMSELKRLAVEELPPKDKAATLVDRYYKRAAWEMAPVPRSRLIKEMFIPCYDNLPTLGVGYHELSFLWAVLALGMLQSPEELHFSALSHRYINLSRACLSIDNYIDNMSISSIDSLLLQASYMFMTDNPTTGPRPWVTVSLAMKIAQAIGLHREPSMWGLPEDECSRRRRTMWELVCCDLWGALISGRPPTMSKQHFDVQLPLESPDVAENEPNYSRGKYHFSDTCLWGIIDLGLASTNKATYTAVLKMDTRIRDWRLPKSMEGPEFPPAETEKTGANFRHATQMIFREISLLCLHRAYFACALLEPPYEPLASQYARSVLAEYASACTILNHVRTLYAREPIMIMRFSFFWIHSLSAAIVLGAIVTRAPDCSIAPNALTEFDLAVDLFTQAQSGCRAGRALPTLIRLQKKAHTAMDAYKNGTWIKNSTTDSQLFRGLKGYNAIVHRGTKADELIPPGQPAVQRPDVMTSLENIPSSIEDHLRSFNIPDSSSGRLASPNFSSSDEFLYRVIYGGLGSLNPGPIPPGPSELSHSSIGSSPMGVNTSVGLHADQSSLSSAQTLLSSIENSLPLQPDETASMYSFAGPAITNPPATVGHTLPPTFGPSMIAGEENQATILWDQFLQELGV